MGDVADLGDGVEDLLAQAVNGRRAGFVRRRSGSQWGNRHRQLTPP